MTAAPLWDGTVFFFPPRSLSLRASAPVPGAAWFCAAFLPCALLPMRQEDAGLSFYLKGANEDALKIHLPRLRDPFGL